MDVPLSVSTAVIKGREKLSIWYNGKKHVINAPIEPYFYTKEELKHIPRVPETVDAVALSDYQKKRFYKYSFGTRKRLVDVRNGIGIEHAFESNIPFILRNRIDNPDLFTKFPHTKEIQFLFLDIEQYSKPEEMFPTYEDRIISIAWCGNDRDIKCAFLKKENESDEKLLKFFIEKYNEIDPDVVVVYNKNYDIPTIIRRCERNNINTSCFAKDESKPYIGGRNKINIEGVVIYDVYDSARVDQSLNGNVANRGLKEVSDYFEFDSGREPLDTKSMHKFVGTPELVDYNKDDVERLLVCFDTYWPNIEFNANDLRLPLNEVVDMNITNLGLVVIGDEHHRLNIIADGLNKHRYREVFLRKKKSTDSNYEGALTDIFKTGLFEPIYKADYSCVDEKTEALTNRGWKKYWEINDNDKLVTWDVRNDKFDLENPLAINVHDYDGELIYSDSRNISMAVTPNHRVYYYKVRGEKKGGLFVDRADNLQTYIDVPINSFYGGETPEKYERYIPLMAWIITEGCVHWQGNSPRIMLSQRKCVSLDNSIDYLRNVLKKSGLPFREKKRKNRPDVEFYLNAETTRVILSMMDNDGKHIPDFIFWCDRKTREMFISEMIYGDGTDYRVLGKANSRVYGSKDKKLIDEFQMLCTLTGYRTTVNRCYINGRKMYYTHVFRRKVTGLRLNQVRPTKDKLYRVEQYKGKVWCPTTKNQTWVCRRNGKIHITGNSLYPSIMSSFNLSPDTTTLLEYKPYTGNFTVKEEDQWYIYNVPDKVIKKDMVIQVLKTPGFSALLVERFLKERSEYKALWKSTGLRKYRAMSDNRKLKANGGVYGIQGTANHAFGFLPAAVATCGAGRECAGLLRDILNELYPKSVIEIDSVTGDTPIFVRDKKTKEIETVLIEDLSDGSLRNTVSNIETLTRSGWKNLNYVYCHAVNKNIYTVETREGGINVTEDHSLFSNEKEVKPSELVKGSVIDLYPKGKVGVVVNISYKKRNCKVYDLGTDDGTFVAGVGRVICHNTDGVYYTTKNHDEDRVKELFEERIYERFQKDDLKLSIDFDSYKKGYFYKTKNYVLLTDEDKMIFHGVAMKASSKNTMSKKLIRKLAESTLDRRPIDVIVKDYLKLDFPLKHFAMSITMGMHMRDYKKPDSTLVVQLAKEAERQFNIKPEIENQYYYVKTTYGYKLLEATRLGEIDRPYYREQVTNIADMFSKSTITPKISKWL